MNKLPYAIWCRNRIERRYWLTSASRESLMIPICDAFKRGWSRPVNLAIYRRHAWKMITDTRKLPS